MGHRSDFVYRILAGEAHEADNVIGPGGFVGEIGVLVGTPRGATVKVRGGSKLEQLKRSEFLALLSADPALAEILLRSLSLRTWALMEQLSQIDGDVSNLPVAIEAATFKSRMILFLAKATSRLSDIMRRQAKFIPEDLARKDRKARIALFATFAQKKIAKGQPLFTEDDPSENVYWIKSGVVHITKRTKSGERLVGRAQAGEIVGELGVLESIPRSSSARAATRTVVQVIPAAAFRKILGDSASICHQVIDSLCERARFLMREHHRLQSREHAAPDQELAVYQAICSMESVARLAEQRFANELIKMRRLFLTQVDHGKEIVHVYRKHSRGEALPEELERANAHFIDYLKLAGLGTLLVLPGAPLSIPLASKMGKALGIDIFPTADDEA